MTTTVRDRPQLTSDLAHATDDLDRHGFCLISDALSPTQVGRVRARLVEQAAAEAAEGVGYNDGGGSNQRVWNMVNKGEAFEDLLLHPLVGQVMPHLLGDRFLVSSLTANIAGPGGDPMVLHQDQGYVPFPHPPYALVANIGWLLDDTTAANGGTRFVPGSHLWDGPLRDQTVTTVAAEGPAGTAVVFDGRIWHGTGANDTDGKRHVVLSYFCRPFIRQQENPFLSMSPEVEARLRPELRRLLGYRIWGTLGGVEGPHTAGPDGFVSRPARPIGRMA